MGQGPDSKKNALKVRKAANYKELKINLQKVQATLISFSVQKRNQHFLSQELNEY
jgi:hypothetical protein